MGKKYCMLLYFYGNYTSFAAKRKLSEICAFFFWDAVDDFGGNAGAFHIWQVRSADAKNQPGRIFPGT